MITSNQKVLILIIMEDTHGVEAAFNAGRESVVS